MNILSVLLVELMKTDLIEITIAICKTHKTYRGSFNINVAKFNPPNYSTLVHYADLT